MVLVGQKEIRLFVVIPSPKHPIRKAKAIQKNPVLMPVLYPSTTARAIAATRITLIILFPP